MFISMGKPKLDFIDLKFNHKVDQVVKKIKPIDGITDCWAVDMTASSGKDIAIVASLVVRTKEEADKIFKIVSKFEGVVEVKYDLGDSLINN